MENTSKKLLFFFRFRSFGLSLLGLHKKSAPVAETFSSLIDDVGNTLIDNEANILQAKD